MPTSDAPIRSDDGIKVVGDDPGPRRERRPGRRQAARANASLGPTPAAPGAPAPPTPPGAPGVEPTGSGRSRGPAAGAARAREARGGAGRAWKAVAVLGVLGTLGFGIAWRSAEGQLTSDGRPKGATEMASAARGFTSALTTFEANTLNRDFDRITSYATGSFAKEASAFYDDKTRTALKDAKAASRGDIRSLYVESFGGDYGDVFVVVDQTIANNRTPQPVSDTIRMVLSMQRVAGRWKVAKVVVLQAPASSQASAAGLPSTPTKGG